MNIIVLFKSMARAIVGQACEWNGCASEVCTGRNIQARPDPFSTFKFLARYILGIWDTGKCKLLTVAKSCFWEKRPGPCFDTEFTARPGLCFDTAHADHHCAQCVILTACKSRNCCSRNSVSLNLAETNSKLSWFCTHFVLPLSWSQIQPLDTDYNLGFS
jgi:hypothetical protein